MLDLDGLLTADRPALLQAWRDCFGTPPPKGMSQVFLRRFIGFELQAQEHGGIKRATLKALSAPKPVAPPKKAKIGTQFFREWNGTTHRVELTNAGYAWNGKVYRSLSAIAREITGARWSGRRFFGLKDGAA
jgi:hypothetical protein